MLKRIVPNQSKLKAHILNKMKTAELAFIKKNHYLREIELILLLMLFKQSTMSHCQERSEVVEN